MATPCDVGGCDATAIAGWMDSTGQVMHTCERHGNRLKDAGWDYVSEI